MLVLLVEDEPDNRHWTAELLRAYGHEVLSTTDGATGLLLAATNGAIDCIITDLAMPVMDGITFINRAREAGVKCPIGVISAYYPENAPLQGADFTMHKPVEPEELIKKLEELVKKGSGV